MRRFFGIASFLFLITLQQAYIAEKSQIGSFDSITFVKPEGSQYFTYSDETPTGGDCGSAKATSKVKIGDCGANSIWQTMVPNSTDEISRRVSTAEEKACAKLSPATYQTEGTITASSCSVS